MITIEQVEAKKDEYERLVEAFLRQQGWKQASIPPGQRVWKKSPFGTEILCKADSAMKLETAWALYK